MRTVAVGSRWVRKYSPRIEAKVVSVLDWKPDDESDKVRFIIHAVYIDGRYRQLVIFPVDEFTKLYHHPADLEPPE